MCSLSRPSSESLNTPPEGSGVTEFLAQLYRARNNPVLINRGPRAAAPEICILREDLSNLLNCIRVHAIQLIQVLPMPTPPRPPPPVCA